MFGKYPIDNLSQSSLNCARFRQLVIALDEQNEELLLGRTSAPVGTISVGGVRESNSYYEPHKGAGMTSKIIVESV